MAKNDNLTHFLTDLADAIREKEGSTGLINPQEFSERIRAIEGGGGNAPSAPSGGAVNFRDYDGTILHSYTKDAFLALAEMPTLPTRQGLTCQGWNYNLEDAKAYVSEYGVLEVGATYITDDGKTRLYITIAAEGRMDVPLYFSQTLDNGVTIDWGDGSATETLAGTGNVNTTHHYNEIGDYVISLEVADGCTLGLGHGSSSYCAMGSTGNNNKVYCNILKKVEIGSNVNEIASHSFNNCDGLEAISIPNTINKVGLYSFKSIYDLKYVALPKGMTAIDSYAFEYCDGLEAISIPNTITFIDSYAFEYCYSLVSAVMPLSVTTIAYYMFRNAYAIPSIVVPNSIRIIDTGAFRDCYGMGFYDFSHLKSIPSLSNTNAFQNIPSDCKIVVPDALYDEWIAATNWSTYASRIMKASEFNA